MLKRFFLLSVALFCLLALAGSATVAWLVVSAPDGGIDEGNIEKILAVESPVYYRDGHDTIGVFFEETHRQYVPYDKIPKAFVNAIVAAEDHDFFEHHGVDVWGMVRAMAANIRAGRIVQGGSTITQQTAKNLFKRQDRSIEAKLKELLYALQLEYRYPKSKILEFYANQFYVSGNGRGLGVAAHYYFDKPVEDLDVLECAFIAGSVKSPNTYNPFTKRDDAAADRARLLAKRRAGYVLEQMYKLGMIDSALYQTSIQRQIPFRQGRMSYSLNTVMDLVRDALETPQVQEALAEHGIDNIATSGIRIVTTVERDLQEHGVSALRSELSRLDVRLRGYNREEVQKEYAALGPERGDSPPESGAFLFGRIKSVNQAAPAVTVSLGQPESEFEGRIDAAGLMHLAEPLARYERNRWVQAGNADLSSMLKQLRPGDTVFVHVREVDPLSGRRLLDLERYPKLQGGLMVMKDGTIRAMAGGFENHFFNRAVSSKRPMGSVIKPLVYAAALQLGWNSIDTLDNERNVFVFQKQPYFPRPDHESPYGRVSMAWAGVHSENLATVWLLYHLCDQLSPAQFKELVAHLGLGQQPGESSDAYTRRIRDQLGVVVDQDALRRVAFGRAVARIEPDLLFDGRVAEEAFLRKLHYGSGYGGYETALVAEQAKAGGDHVEQRELALRQGLLRNNYLRLAALRGELRRLRQAVEGGMMAGAAAASPESGLRPAQLFLDPASGRLLYDDVAPAGQWRPVGREELRHLIEEKAGRDPDKFWGEVLVGGEVRAVTLDLLGEAISREYTALAGQPAYGTDVLHQVRDFRVLVGLRYLIGLCRQLGIESKLDPVLSFPLGSNVVSLLEVARAYEALAGGSTFLNAQDKVGDAIAIIDRVEDSDGKIIFEPQRQQRRVVAPQTTVAVCDIMRNVVRFGTGSYANDHVLLESPDPDKARQLAELRLRWPVLGKTGTANRYTNAAFAGVVPAVQEGGNCATLHGGYVVTAYVGFDDNTPMVRTSTHITGSTGALPLWTDLAKSIIMKRNYAGKMDVVDFYFATSPEVPLRYDDLGEIRVPVDAAAGGKEVAGTPQEPADIVTFGSKTPDGIAPERLFLPYWRAGESGK